MVAVGCSYCYHTGYHGRKALYEVIPVTPHLQQQVKAEGARVNDYLVKQKISSLSDAAFTLLQQGETTITEIYSILT